MAAAKPNDRTTDEVETPRRPVQQLAQAERRRHAEHDARGAAEQAERQRFHQELRSTSRRRAPSDSRRPISRVRSVTDTSMMFMMPMPPTSSETAATLASS